MSGNSWFGGNAISINTNYIHFDPTSLLQDTSPNITNTSNGDFLVGYDQAGSVPSKVRIFDIISQIVGAGMSQNPELGKLVIVYRAKNVFGSYVRDVRNCLVYRVNNEIKYKLLD